MIDAASLRGAHGEQRGSRRSPPRAGALAGLRLVAFWALLPTVIGYTLLFSPCGIGRYVPGLAGVGRLGAIGYSSLYGAFNGEDD